MASSRAPTLSRTPDADQRRQLVDPPFARIAYPTAGMDSLTVHDFDQAGRIFPSGRTLVMGVLNVTPDSFSDGGQFTATGRAIERARAMAGEGADILDIGGESTRPGATPIAAEEELARVLPVVSRAAAEVSCPISIDTYKATVAERAIAAGARIVNDVWGLSRDPAMAGVVAAGNVGLIVMHNRATIDAAVDMLDEVLKFLERSLETARCAGIDEARIAVDPGIGFGKTLEQNLMLIARLGVLRKWLGRPVLLGASRKSLIGRISPSEPGERLAGTLALHSAGILAGAGIIRAHDVYEAVQAARVTDRLKGYWPP
jgi:dihydropteroate synthase